MNLKARVISWCSTCVVIMGALGGCGPVESTEPVASQAPSPSKSVPFDVNDVVRRAREGLPTMQAAATSVSPELPVDSGPLRQITPAVAAGNGIYLVVWSELIAPDPYSSSTDPDIWAVRVRASDGALLDPAPIRLAEGPPVQWNPAVAFDGTNFLVVWNHYYQQPPHVFGTRVRASDGAVLDTPHLISNVNSPIFSQLPEYNPSVAFDGTNYLVTWEGWYVTDAVQHYTAFGAFVSASDGQLVDPYGFIIGKYPSSPPKVAYTQGRYMVVYQGGDGSLAGEIAAVRIDAASRSLIDTTPLRLTVSAETETAPSVASSNGQFLVVWGGANNRIRGLRLRSSNASGFEAPSADLGEGGVTPASVTFDGSDYRVTWQGTRNSDRKLVSVRVSPTSGVVPGSELVLSSVAASSEKVAPGIAAVAAGKFVVAYGQADHIRLRLVNDVIPPPCGEGAPVLILNGGAEMTLECKVGGTYSDPGAQAFDGCGNPLQVHAYNTGSDSSGPGPLMSYEGSYSVSYSAWDAMGRTVNATRTVNVDDRTAPSLKLKGAASVTHTCGSQWQDPGVEALDACYGDISTWAWRTGEVNSWAAGTYTVTYAVADSGGNSATPVTRTVQVVNCPW